MNLWRIRENKKEDQNPKEGITTKIVFAIVHFKLHNIIIKNFSVRIKVKILAIFYMFY